MADLLGPRELQIRCLEQLIEIEAADSVAGLRAQARLLWSLTRTADVERAATVGAQVMALAESLGDEAVYTAALVDLANQMAEGKAPLPVLLRDPCFARLQVRTAPPLTTNSCLSIPSHGQS